jgi:hypothetical protein
VGDVETIKKPKSKLKNSYPQFSEIDDGGRILEDLDVEQVLSNPETCAGLRTLFAWCIKAIKQNPTYQDLMPPERYRLHDGRLSAPTKAQLESL